MLTVLQALLDSIIPSLSQPPGIRSNATADSHGGADGRWQLLAALLQMPGSMGWSPPVGAILTAAAAACAVKVGCRLLHGAQMVGFGFRTALNMAECHNLGVNLSQPVHNKMLVAVCAVGWPM